MPTRGTRPGSKTRVTFPDGKLGPDPRYYDPANIRPRPRHQAAYIRNRAAARARALLPPSEPIIRERLCRICQRPITWGFKRWYCESCRSHKNDKFNRRLISQRRAAGLCVRCGELAVEGHTCCVRCKAISRKRYKPGAAAVRSTRQLEDRKARAVCTLCEAPAATGRLRCVACLADSRARHRRDRAHWRAAGLCVGCGRTPRRGVKLCAVCLARGKKLRTENQAAGYCRCGRFVTPGRKSCGVCLSRAREYQRRRRSETASGCE